MAGRGKMWQDSLLYRQRRSRGGEMDCDDYGPTIEDEIRWNDELSPVEKTLLIQKSKIEFYRDALTLVLLFLLLGAIGTIVKGWLLAIIDGAIFWGTAIAYTLLEDKKNSIEIALAEESQNRQKTESRNKKRR
jgi:hypothetical protein